MAATTGVIRRGGNNEAGEGVDDMDVRLKKKPPSDWAAMILPACGTVTVRQGTIRQNT
jgi:hypothetical protein